ncbi:MAG TPA: hypothetical protein VIK64_07310 [Anaerolineales bacterium]
MADEILLYISAASDLEIERDLVGRAITEIPVTLGWRIKQTPHGEKVPDLEAVAKADVHLMLLGSDIRAPTGMELLIAQRSRKKPLFFRKSNAVRTPAAQVFLREMERSEKWRTFRDNSDLRHQVLTALADHILNNAIHYSLRPDEYEGLRSWREELEKAGPQLVEETRGGTGESGIIISTERYVPSEGILIKKPDQN